MGKQIGFEQISKNAIAQSSRAEQFEKLPPDQQAKQIQISATVAPLHLYKPAVLNLIIFVIIAAVLMATFNFGGRGQRCRSKHRWRLWFMAAFRASWRRAGDCFPVRRRGPGRVLMRKTPWPRIQHILWIRWGNKFLYGMASALDVFSPSGASCL